MIVNMSRGGGNERQSFNIIILFYDYFWSSIDIDKGLCVV